LTCLFEVSLQGGVGRTPGNAAYEKSLGHFLFITRDTRSLS